MMKKGWEYKKLGEVANICGGKRIPKGYKLQCEPTSHKYIRVADFLDNGTVCEDDIQYISDEVFNQIKRYTISSDDVYISIAGTIGKSGIVSDKLNGANLTENACKLVLCTELDKRFVYFVTTSPLFKKQINTLTKKSAQPKLALTRLATVEIPVPPLSEQKEIVEYLDSSFAKIDTLKANAAKNLDEAKALFQSALKEALEPKKGWDIKKIGEVADIVHGKNQKDVISTHGKYPIYGSGGTVMGYATEYLCKAGTIILGRKGTINNPQYINHKFWNVDTAFGIVAKESIDSKYLFFFIKKQDWEKMNTGTTLPSLTQAIVKNVDIPLPPLSEQQEIVSRLDSLNEKVNTLQQNYSRICSECDALKQSILRQVFE